ncbi:Bax inhibitor-1/YccA family protein [Pseudobacteriovorax antillogorgiicola]
MRSGNPALKQDTFSVPYSQRSTDVMTLNGTVNKCFISGMILLIAAMFVWERFFGQAEPVPPMGYIWGGSIGGFIVALVTIFKKQWSPYTVPLYAGLEGLFLGGISAMFELRFPGIVVQAVGLTMMVFIALLMAYKSGLIKATENFKLGITAATGGIALFYLLQIILGFFGVTVPYIHESGAIGIGFSLFVVVIAALNLVMDFDFIEAGAESGAPKYMEWFGAFGLLVTLIWLYLEILRLLSKLQSRD